MKASLAAVAVLALGALHAVAQPPANPAGHEHHHAPAHDADSAIGRPGDTAKATRTIAITMSDAMRFDPAAIRVKTGETIRFELANAGKLDHEFVLGAWKDLEEHAALMRRFPHMQHEEPNMAHLAPGAQASIVWQFTRPGEFHYACLVPGHFEAGMTGKVTVAQR